MITTLDFVVVGAQKAASTWVTENLNQHPGLLIPIEEIPCFEQGFETNEPLKGFYERRINAKFRGIKNNNLFFTRESAELLFMYSNRLKIILSLRDPVDRLISSYYWHMAIGKLPIKSPEVGIKELLEQENESLLYPGFYGEHLRRFLKYFDREQIHVLLLEDIKSDPYTSLAMMYKFLGVDHDYRSSRINSRPKESIYSLPRLKWNALRNKHIYYNAAGSSERLLWKTSPSALNQIISASIVGADRIFLSKIFKNNKPHISTQIKQQIASIYAADCKQLQDIIGRDLSSWLPVKLS